MVRDKFRERLNLISSQDKAIIFYKLVRIQKIGSERLDSIL
jgi:hypothetical protein